MPGNVLTNAYLAVNAVNLSTYLKSVENPQGVDFQDATAMATPPVTKIGKPGLLTGSFKAKFLQDYGAGGPDQTLSPLLGITTTIEVRPVNGAVTTTNPKWTATVFITSYNPVAGEVGGMQTCDVTFELASAMVRGTA